MSMTAQDAEGAGLTPEQVAELSRLIVAHSRPGMRLAIGDRTPKQYDRADQMARSIDRAVRTALAEMDLADDESTDA